MEQKNTSGKVQDFISFCQDNADREVIKEFVREHKWDDSYVMQGDIRTATQYLKANQPPSLLLVEIPSSEQASSLLDGLAEVCSPDTKVIIVGNINEYSFYCWLTEIGIFSYLLRPLSKEALEGAYKKSLSQSFADAAPIREPAKVIGVVGARGGVGSSTVALNLAGIFAEYSDKKIALVDLDPQEGTLSLVLDIEPARGLRDALEKPDRIDALFIDRVMNKPHENLWLLSAEEPIKEPIRMVEETADALIDQLCDKYDVVVLDIPRRMRQFSRQCLKKTNDVVLVAELSLQSLRDTLRLSDLMVDSFKMSPPKVIANRVGVAPKNEIGIADFEKGILAKVVEKIMYSPEIFMEIGIEIPSISHAKHASVKPLYSLAKLLLPALNLEEEQKSKSPFGFIKKK